jgi:hypothetical protein
MRTYKKIIEFKKIALFKTRMVEVKRESIFKTLQKGIAHTITVKM